MIRIDWTNPITKGLVFASVGSQPDINLVDGARPSDGTTFAVRPGADGLGLDPNDLTFAPTDGSFWNKWHDSGRTFGFATYSLLLRETDTGTNDTILEIKINSNRHTLRFVNAAQNETISVSYYDTTETQINAGPVATPIGIDGKAHGAACSCESDGTLTLYGDGISLGTPGTTSNPGFLAQTLNNGFGVGNDWTGGTNWPGLIYLSLLWTRPLSAVEHAQLHANPWQIFIDTSRPIIGAHQLPTHVNYGMVKVPWTKQPPPGTPLDLDNPLTRGLDLVDAMDDPKGQDVAGNYPRLSVNDAIPRVSRQPGRGQYWDASAGASSVRRGYSVGNDFSGIPEITVASLHRIVSAQANGHFFIKKDRSGFLSWELYKTGTGGSANRYWMFVNTSGGSYGNDAGTVLADDYDPHLVVGVFKTDSHLQVWLDGALYASDADTPTGNITTRSWVVTFAGEDDGLGGVNQSPQDEEMFLNCVWSRALSDAEIKTFSANPWQIFKPREIMVPINEDLPELGTFEKPWDDMPL